MKYIRYAILPSISLLLLATPVFAHDADLDSFDLINFVLFLAFFFGFFLLAVLLVVCLLNMQQALNRVSPHNRLVRPGMVWLGLIAWLVLVLFPVPVIYLVWGFVMAIRVPDSLKNEFRDRGLGIGTDYGKLLGIAHCSSIFLCFVLLVIFNVFFTPPTFALLEFPPYFYPDDFPPSQTQLAFLSVITTLFVASVVSGIMFWVKLRGYTKQLGSDDSARLNGLDALDDGHRNAQPGTKSKPSEGIQEADGQ